MSEYNLKEGVILISAFFTNQQSNNKSNTIATKDEYKTSMSIDS